MDAMLKLVNVNASIHSLKSCDQHKLISGLQLIMLSADVLNNNIKWPSIYSFISEYRNSQIF